MRKNPFKRLPTLATMQATRRALPKPRPRVLTAKDQAAKERTQERACRAAVDARDHRQCFFPSCGVFASEKHHILARSLGGAWVTANILSTCALHHRLFKAGLIRTVGNPDNGPVTVVLTALGVREGLTIPIRP